MPKDISIGYGFPPRMLSLCILGNFSFKSGQSYCLFETQWVNEDKTASCFSFHDIWREITCLMSALRENRASGIEMWTLIPSQPRFSKKIFQRWKINRLFFCCRKAVALSWPWLLTFFWQPYWQWQAAKILAGWAFQSSLIEPWAVSMTSFWSSQPKSQPQHFKKCNERGRGRQAHACTHVCTHSPMGRHVSQPYGQTVSWKQFPICFPVALHHLHTRQDWFSHPL